MKIETEEDKLIFLDCLIEAGVDNWDGYEVAVELYDSVKLECNKEGLV